MNPPEIYKSYFDRYTALVTENDLPSAFEKQNAVLDQLCERISEEKSAYAYAENKWTLKEVLQHLIDTERIFAYRALAIARKDPANLPGYDENLYAENSGANRRAWADLVKEIEAVRQATKFLFASFDAEALAAVGTFNNNSGEVKTLGMIIVGHFYHHVNVVNERYF